MSIKSMLDKVKIDEPHGVEPPRRQAAKTAPGRLMQFGHELEDAERKLAEYEGSLPTRRLDSRRIRPSALRNRHEDSFVGDAWVQFKRDIAAAGGNTQPIKVRPISDPAFDYEIVFGHRRHRACLESDIPVLAMIEAVSDRDLFEAMTRENVGRNDLSVWEWGEHYQRGLVHGFYTTQAQLAAANQRSEGHVAVCLQIAGLPAEVLAAFRSPLVIQWRWGIKLVEVHKQDPDGLRSRALAVAKAEPVLPPQQVFAKLVSGADTPPGKSFEIKRAGKRAATIEARGTAVSVKFSRGVVTGKRLVELRKLVEGFIAQNDAESGDL